MEANKAAGLRRGRPLGIFVSKSNRAISGDFGASFLVFDGRSGDRATGQTDEGSVGGTKRLEDMECGSY